LAAFDTNVIVRLLTGDDPIQTRKAERAFTSHAEAQGVFLSLVVLAEIVWVLRLSYNWNREIIHAKLEQLIRTRGVNIEDLDLVQLALDEYRTGTADFADYLILGKARTADNDAVLLTFDKKLAAHKNGKLL
jgi:predicted nucleic-acid-binding protein